MASDDDLYDSKFLENVDVLVDKYPHVNVLRGRVVRIDKKKRRDRLGIPFKRMAISRRLLLVLVKRNNRLFS